MTSNEEEYKIACDRLRDEKLRMLTEEDALRKMGLNEVQVKKAMEPMRSWG